MLGGPRRQKRFEKALQARGLMPPGTFAVPAGGAPLDSNGNIPGSFIVQLLSYFNAFGEQGYRPNMMDKRRKQIEKVGRSIKGYRTINGVAYFVSNGSGHNSHLPAGIYSKTGTHGSNVRPVILFVRTPSCSARLPFFETVEKTVQRRFNVVFGA